MSNRFNKTIGYILNDIAGLYPYLLLFYLVSLFVSYFIPPIRLFFYWPAFHISMIALGFLTLLSPKMIEIYTLLYSESKKGIEKGGKAAKKSLSPIGILILSIVTLTRKKRLLKMLNVAKVTAIFIIMAYAYSRNVNVYDFVTILFALISVLFVIDSRISAGIAILLLTACPVLLLLKKDILAEQVAVYAFYFLVITVVTQIEEFRGEKGPDKG